MKKTLVSALTSALVIGAASTTFAAANPFEDVPADHWAYDAVAQLAADGVIEGYGDGTYRGDQEITRYEMAQMVARAMAKNNVSGADKAMIDKLAAEFADELKSLGVRVAALEKKVDNVKWTGTVRYRYWNEHHEGIPHNNANYVTFRLEPEARINKHWTGHARIDYSVDMNSARNATNGDIAEDADKDFRVERAWVQGEYGNTQILLGKLPYITNVDGGMIMDDNVAGGQITFGNKNIKATVTLGRANHDADERDYASAWNGENATSSYQAIEIYNDREENKFSWGLGFHRFANKTQYNMSYGDGKKSATIWEIGLGYKFDKNIALNGAYAWNNSPSSSVVGSANKRAYSVELDYTGADAADKGSFGIFAAYRHLGYTAVWLPTYDAIADGQKGWEFGVDYVPMKNVMATVKYFRGKDIYADTASKLFTEINFFF